MWISETLIFALFTASTLSQHIPYNQDEIDEIVRVNNQYRREEGASNMYQLSWNNSLADLALVRAAKCQFSHGDTFWNVNGKQKRVGQNLYFCSHDFESSKPSDVWYLKEKPLYNYDDRSCTGMCGHYTQIVWSSTQQIGCAKYLCADFQDFGRERSDIYYVACDYFPPGNMKGMRPYKKGDCSGCESGFCNDGLCVDQCSPEDTNCVCSLKCENCGKVTKDCKCECPPSFSGRFCEVPCQDKTDDCGTKYPKAICGYQNARKLMKKWCPVMCGFCEPEDPAVTEHWCKNELASLLTQIITDIETSEPERPSSSPAQGTKPKLPAMPQMPSVPQTQPDQSDEASSESATSSISTSSMGCGSSYQVMEDYKAESDKNSVDIPGATNAVQCLESCTANVNCKSADWLDTNACVIHTIKQPDFKRARTATSYKKVYCTQGDGCMDGFIKSPGKSLKGSKKVFGPKDVNACADMCRHRPKCAGFSFDDKTAPDTFIRCKLFDDDDEKIVEKIGSTHYIKERCSDSAECAIDYYEIQDRNSWRGVGHQGVLDEEECRKTCTEMQCCTSYDYVTKDKPYQNMRCFTYDLNDVPKKKEESIHYIKQVDCGAPLP